MEQLKEKLSVTSLTLVQKDTVSDALEALYDNEGDVLVLNQAFSSSFSSIAKYASSDTVSSSTGSFVIYVAGHDASSTSFSLYGRTDVDMMVAVNPTLKQILMISIPRDYYIKNPALDNGLDKLTHLGNDGIQNTLDGINQEFGLNITDYIVTDFDHFSALVDNMGGITMDNPYAFSGRGYDFAEGTITLNDSEALAYSRERYSLSNGDYGRNEHHGIVMEGLLKKIQENCRKGEYLTVIKSAMDNISCPMFLWI